MTDVPLFAGRWASTGFAEPVRTNAICADKTNDFNVVSVSHRKIPLRRLHLRQDTLDFAG
jgi:hypothetical protein